MTSGSRQEESNARGRLSVTLVKLGGSLITDKTKPRTVAREHLQRLAAEIAAGWSGGGLIIGHGSGSFGHPRRRGRPAWSEARAAGGSTRRRTGWASSARSPRRRPCTG